MDRVVGESGGELVVVGRGRWHLGTTWWVELRRAGDGKGEGRKGREEGMLGKPVEVEWVCRVSVSWEMEPAQG